MTLDHCNINSLASKNERNCIGVRISCFFSAKTRNQTNKDGIQKLSEATAAPLKQMMSLNLASSVSLTLHICCTPAAGPQSSDMNTNKRPTQWQQHWWLNSLGKCLPAMRGNLRWGRAWKRPAAAHKCCSTVVSQQIKYIWLSACQLLLPCGLDLSVCFQHAWINLSGKVDEWSHERLSSSFSSSRRVEHWRHYGFCGCKAKSHVVSTWFQLLSIRAFTHERHMSRNWSPSKFNKRVVFFCVCVPGTSFPSFSFAKQQFPTIF